MLIGHLLCPKHPSDTGNKMVKENIMVPSPTSLQSFELDPVLSAENTTMKKFSNLMKLIFQQRRLTPQK